MKKFQMLKAGDYILYAVEVPEHTAKVIERETECFSLYHGDRRFVTLESYLSFKDIKPMDIEYHLGATAEDITVNLSYSKLTYDEVRSIKCVFGEENMFIEGDWNHPSVLKVVCKLNLA